MPLNDVEVLKIADISGDVELQENKTSVRKTRKGDEPSGKNTLNSIADIFHVKNKLQRIFVIGDAGRGKSVLCLKLLETWAHVKRDEYLNPNQVHKTVYYNNEKQFSLSSTEQRNENRLMKCLSVYELVFHVSLRYAECLSPGRSVVDLVCESVPKSDHNDKERIKQMLGDSTIPCLVILDGLDEYKLPSVPRVKEFLERGLVNTVVLCTMRPWRMVCLELGLDSNYDKVVKICGLKEESVEKVFSNILLNFYVLHRDSNSLKAVEKKFKESRMIP